MTSSLVLQDVLDAVAREVVDTFGAHYCVIWEYVEEADTLVERAGFGVDDDFGVDGESILLDERPKEREILFSAEPVLETVSDPQLDEQSRESMERWGEKTCLSLPLRFGDATLGLLVVCETERERRFSGRRWSSLAVSPTRRPRPSTTRVSTATSRSAMSSSWPARAASGC